MSHVTCGGVCMSHVTCEGVCMSCHSVWCAVSVMSHVGGSCHVCVWSCHVCVWVCVMARIRGCLSDVEYSCVLCHMICTTYGWVVSHLCVGVRHDTYYGVMGVVTYE